MHCSIPNCLAIFPRIIKSNTNGGFKYEKSIFFYRRKKNYFRQGSLSTLASHIKELNAKNPLVVIDKNLAKAGFQDKVAAILIPEGIKFTVYDKVEPEPRIELADEGAKIAD